MHVACEICGLAGQGKKFIASTHRQLPELKKCDTNRYFNRDMPRIRDYGALF